MDGLLAAARENACLDALGVPKGKHGEMNDWFINRSNVPRFRRSGSKGPDAAPYIKAGR